MACASSPWYQTTDLDLSTSAPIRCAGHHPLPTVRLVSLEAPALKPVHDAVVAGDLEALLGKLRLLAFARSLALGFRFGFGRFAGLLFHRLARPVDDRGASPEVTQHPAL